MTSFSSARKAIAMALDGKMPDEAMLRSAKGELDLAEAVVISAPEPLVLVNRVTTEEALLALKDLFLVMENTMLVMRRSTKNDLLISSDVADLFIRTRDILQRGGCELVANRRHEPLTFTRPASPR